MLSTSNIPSKAVCTARVVGWIVASLVVAAALGWLAAQASAKWAPLVIFPILLGVAIGAMLVVLMRMCQVHSGWVVYPIAIVAVALVVLSQHWFVYQEAMQAMREEVQTRQEALRQFPEQFRGEIPTLPANFFEYLQSEADRPREIAVWYQEMTLQGTRTWLFWGLNMAIILLIAMIILYQGRVRPWCSTCRTWYQVTRRGRLDRETTDRLLTISQATRAIDSEQKSDEDAAADAPAGRYASFIISDCDGRCGRTVLRILRTTGTDVEIYHLDRDQRREVEAILDADQS